MSSILSFFIVAAIFFKIAAFIIVDHVNLASVLNNASFIFLISSYLLGCIAFFADSRGMFISISIACIFSLLFLHALFMGVDAESSVIVLLPILVSTLYILPMRFLSKEELDLVLSLASIALIIKMSTSIGIALLIFSGFLSLEKDSLELYLGKMTDNMVFYDSVGMFKIYEKGLVVLPLALYFYSKYTFARFVQVGILILACFASLTLSFYASLLTLIFAFIYRDLRIHLYKRALVAIFLIGCVFAYFSTELSMIFFEKEDSVAIKVNQWTSVSSFDSLLGLGVGSQNVPTLQSGDVYIENSYILLYYWLGLFVIPFLLFFFYLLFVSINNLNFSRANILSSTTIISIIISSGSNAYIFSGGVLVILFLCLRRLHFTCKLK